MVSSSSLFQNLIWLALAGALGTISRWGLGLMVQRWLGFSFPWGTLVVNVLGCFLFGLVWSLAENKFFISNAARVVILTGFMGAFTTFSTFAFETGEMMRHGEWPYAFVNLLVQNALGLLFLFMGLSIGARKYF